MNMTNKEKAIKAIQMLPPQFKVVGLIVGSDGSGGFIPIDDELFVNTLAGVMAGIIQGKQPTLKRFGELKNEN